MSRLLIVPWLLLLLGALTAADPAAAALATIGEANAARAAQAEEAAQWAAERERLQAILDAIAIERGRMETAAASASAEADAHAAVLAELDDASDLDAIRRQLAGEAADLGERLTRLGAGLPPGIVPTVTSGGDGIDAFDAVVAALAAAERAGGSVAIDIVSGELAGEDRAVKLLRVAAAAGWWLGLDGGRAGSARMVDGKLQLLAIDDPAVVAAIEAAVAIVEGRAQGALVELPFVPLASPAPATP